MKILIPLLMIFLLSCKSNPQLLANTRIEEYILSKIDNPHSFELVSISKLKKDRASTSLDTLLDIGIGSPKDLFDIKWYREYVKKENSLRPDLINYNLRDLKEIESGKNVFYTVDCVFRIKAGEGKRLKKYSFKLDTLYNVTSVEDKTREIDVIK